MPLIGNRSVLHKSPGRFLNGFGTAGGGIASMRSAYSKHGMLRNAYQTFSRLSAIPDGHLAPSAWVMPITGGNMSSVGETVLAFGAEGAGVGGITTTGTSSLTISFADAAGQLISSGTGTATMTFTVADLLMTASIDGTGSASFAITTNTPLMGALAGGNGTATMSFAGTLEPYAIGHMEGSTVDGAVLTTDAITAAVWGVAAASNNTAGTMGAKLNSAAGGGVDYGDMADAVRTELQAELTRILELAKIHGLVVGTDLVVTATTRAAGDIAQTISEAAGTVTVARS